MKKLLIKTSYLLIIFISGIIFSSCSIQIKNTTYKITYETYGGILETNINSYDVTTSITLPIPEREGFNFLGWYEDPSFTTDAVYEIASGSKGNKTFYALWKPITTSKWDLNKIGFNGNGMKFKIKVDNIENVDPFNLNYHNDDRILKQAHLKNIESAYNIDIEYVQYTEEEADGPQRVYAINDNYLMETYLTDDIYVVETSTEYLPILNRGRSIAPLYNEATDFGSFKDVGYVQDELVNKAAKIGREVYGYNPASVTPDYFLYYNATKVKELNLEDPATLWLNGNWNETKFNEWVQTAQDSLKEGEHVLDIDYATYSIGATAAKGSIMVDYKGVLNLTKGSVVNVFNQLQNFYKTGCDMACGELYNFELGKTLIRTGNLNLLNNSEFEFEVGLVPYPIADNQTEFFDKENIDYSKTNFKIPYTKSTCYAFLNFQFTESGMTPNIAFNIMYDLESGMIETVLKPKEEVYYTDVQLNNQSVLRSVSNPNFMQYDGIEMVIINHALKHILYNYFTYCKTIVREDVDVLTYLQEVEDVLDPEVILRQ